MARPLKIAIMIIAGSCMGLLLFMHRGTLGKPEYVSSAECRDCHRRFYDAWSGTLHPRQFRPVESPEDISADFSIDHPAVDFTREEVEYVIGNRWEQVYVKKVDGEYYPLPAKWYITKNEWAPFKDHEKTPMSKKCNGCHTTGFDAKTLEFKEFGIGCEACHGPGSVHIRNRQKEAGACSLCHGGEEKRVDIITSLNSEVCGQCHNRGTGITGGGREPFSFPVGLMPGDGLDGHIRKTTVEDDPEGRFWWGNGVAKNRHQEYGDWQNSKHSRALKLMKEKHTDDRGEITEACLRCHSTDYRLSRPERRPDVESARFGVTCIACHEPHGLDRGPGFVRDGTTLCGGCHIDSMSVKSADKGMRHYPCPPGMVTCVDCHMPKTVRSGGEFVLRSHSFRIVPPEHTGRFGTPNSCRNGGCHQDRSDEWALREYESFYPEKARERIDRTYENATSL